MPEPLPDDVAAALVRGVGSFLREAPAQELPAKLRRYRSFRPQALMAHRSALLTALDDDALRARIEHWLEKDKPRLAKNDARLLRIAAGRSEGWEDELRSASVPAPRKERDAADDSSRVDAERDKARKAKDELKRARDELRTTQRQSAARISELEAEIAALRDRLAAVEREAAAARKEAERSAERADRAERKARSESEKLRGDRDEARKRLRELQKKSAAPKQKSPRSTPAPEEPTTRRSDRAKKRRPLRVPKGRLADDPKTLEGWLARDDVSLVIDGYNVAKADGGYEELQLESQRERLVDAVFTLAKMTGTPTLIVFDAQRVPGRRARKTRRPVTVEWSNPGEIADDHIIERLEGLPQEPVILVTNDKELQERGRGLDATIATSQQLLGLLR